MQARSAVKISSIDWPWLVWLVVLGLVSRIPFASKLLYHWDSINYTLALEEYNIHIHQPQPPGYLLYVLLTRVVHFFVRDPNWTFIGINIVFSILGAVVLYELGRRMFNRRVGAAASLLLLLGPLFWFYGEIALPNAVDAFVVTFTALLLYEVMQGNTRAVLPAAVMLGVAGGFRQQTLVFMAPLAVFAFIRLPFWKMVLGGGVTTAIFLLAFVPMVALSGGLAQYQAAVNGLSSEFFTHTSIFMGGGTAGLLSNLSKLVGFTLYSLGLAVIPLLGWAVVRIRSAGAALKDRRAWFLLIWMLPSLLFYTLIHMGGHGLIFTYLPALLIICGVALDDLCQRLKAAARWPVFSVSLFVILLVNVLLFVAAPNTIGGVKIVNWNTISAHDQFLEERIEMIEDSFDPDTTLIFASQWRHGQYYLPEYWVLSAECGQEEPVANLANGEEYQEVRLDGLAKEVSGKVKTLVLFDLPASCILPDVPASRVRTVEEGGESMQVIDLAPGEGLRYNAGGFDITP